MSSAVLTADALAEVPMAAGGGGGASLDAVCLGAPGTHLPEARRFEQGASACERSLCATKNNVGDKRLQSSLSDCGRARAPGIL